MRRFDPGILQLIKPLNLSPPCMTVDGRIAVAWVQTFPVSAQNT